MQACDAAFALVGGLAVSVRCEPRMTRDVDLAVSVTSDSEAERLVRALSERGWRPTALVEHAATGRLSTARLVSEASRGVVADLLFASSGVEPEVVAEASSLTVIPELTLPVAAAGHLVAMKLLARDDRERPQDADDLRALRAVVDEQDIALARDAVRLTEERGFARGRDLVSALEAWIGSA